MNMQSTKRQTPNARADATGSVGGFTLMELMVSIAILVVIILGVGVMFSGASKAVGMSQATMEEMAGVRAMQQAIARDIQALDREGFLVIACRTNRPWPTNAANYDRVYRFDQLSFLARGEFPNRTGANTSSPFTDGSVATGAHVWWGQGVMEVDASRKPDNSYMVADQSATTPRDALPTGVISNGGVNTVKENECTLLRHTTLLFPKPNPMSNVISPAGQPVLAYPGIEHNEAALTGNEGMAAHISSSRYAVAAATSMDVMRMIGYERSSGGAPSGAPEYDYYTYRFRALDSVYDTEVGFNPFVNGYFRSTPIVLRGVSSFRVDWTDGTVFPPNGSVTPPADLLQRGMQTKWFGPTGRDNNGPMRAGGTLQLETGDIDRGYGRDNSSIDTRMELAPAKIAAAGYGDDYVAVFGSHNKTLWPKALRITIHVANDRIGGRDFVQVVNLPQ
jgi:prepilin-type N-terminal cleavage/methylation domain-containing protein